MADELLAEQIGPRNARIAQATRRVPGDGCQVDDSIDECGLRPYRTRQDQTTACGLIERHAHSAQLVLRFVFPGGNSGEATPVPIPNTEVKLSRADGTAGATLWESRTLPGFFPKARDFDRGLSPFSGTGSGVATARSTYGIRGHREKIRR